MSSNYQGRKYCIIAKKEQYFPIFRTILRVSLGTLAVIGTLSLALFSKEVRKLFTKQKKNIRYGIPANPLEQKATPPQVEEKVELLDPVKKQILDTFTPQMVEALGGVEEVLNFPLMEHWDGNIHVDHLKAPVMRGYHKDGSAFLLFCYFRFSKEFGNKVTAEYLGRTQTGSWKGAYSYPSELNLRSPNPIHDGTVEEKFMLDKISRLMKRKGVGALRQYPGVILIKPSDKRSFYPEKGYLSEKELETYMDLDTLFYEGNVQEGTTELFLYDPRLSADENEDLLDKQFPNIKDLN